MLVGDSPLNRMAIRTQRESDAMPAPFVSHMRRVPARWIDGNGHLNVRWYLHIFDEAMEESLDALGLGFMLIETHGISIMALEIGIGYKRELLKGERVHVTTQQVAFNHKRVHWMQAMYELQTGKLVSTAEWMTAFVDMNSRRSTAIPVDLVPLLTDLQVQHGSLAQPGTLKMSLQPPVAAHKKFIPDPDDS
jgi:acyl-CoA thioester hydrolase